VFDISPDHAIGLYAGLASLPIALAALFLTPARRAVPGTVKAAAVLMAMSGAVHLGLVSTHLEEPVTAFLFTCNGIAYLVLSAAFTWRWWRLASSALLTATVMGYLVYLALGFAGLMVDLISILYKALVQMERSARMTIFTLGLAFVNVKRFSIEGVDALVPMISSPFPNAGRRGVIDFLPEAIIKADPAWKDGNYEKNPDGARLADITYSIFLQTPTLMLEKMPTRDDTEKYVQGQEAVKKSLFRSTGTEASCFSDITCIHRLSGPVEDPTLGVVAVSALG